jgi:hypothetical protein
MYTVTRQRQFPDGENVVEVSAGDHNYTNPDALVAKYAGEFEEFTDPREAVETAIQIVRDWRKDTRDPVHIGIGCTLGMTMPFDPTTFKHAREWARKAYEQAPKCAECGSLLPPKRERFRHELSDGEEFCREYCAEENYRKQIEPETEEE